MDVEVTGWGGSLRDLAGDLPPNDDDVSCALDGRRLDTEAKVIAFLEEIRAQRHEPHHGSA